MRGRDQQYAAKQGGPDGLDKGRYQQMLALVAQPPRAFPTLGILALDALLMVFVVWCIRQGDLALYLLSQPLLAVVFFHGFTVLHECGHDSAFRRSWLNVCVGHLVSPLCLLPFYPWRYIHQEHHAWAGNVARDPVLKALRVWRVRGVPLPVRLAWRSWLPLGAALQHVVYLSYPLVMWRAGELGGAKALRSLVSVAWLVCAHALFWGLVPEATLANVVPAALLFMMAEELVNLPHHTDVSTVDGKLPVWAQHRVTRSCYYPPIVSELLVLNFNFHIEHHLFPSLPWYRLRAARTLVKEALGSSYQEATGIAWNLEHRRRDLEVIVDRYRKEREVASG